MDLGEYIAVATAKEKRIKQYDCFCGKKSNIEQMLYVNGRYYCKECEREMLAPREYFKKRLMLELEKEELAYEQV